MTPHNEMPKDTVEGLEQLKGEATKKLPPELDRFTVDSVTGCWNWKSPIEKIVEEFNGKFGCYELRFCEHGKEDFKKIMGVRPIQNWLRTTLQSQAEQYEIEKRCGKEMHDGSICGCKLNCHLHDWRQRDAMREMVREIAKVTDQMDEQLWVRYEIEAITKKYGVDLSE